MARAVPPWLHRVCIRMHGPKDPMERLLLFGINSCMDDAGECWRGQESISGATCLGVSTIRRKAASVSKQGWLAMYQRGNVGKKWNRISIEHASLTGLTSSKSRSASQTARLWRFIANWCTA